MKKKILVLQGLQGSGKTHLAKEWVSESPKTRVRFNRDDIRNMLGPYWVPEREELINYIYINFLSLAMAKGYDIVIDNMNLNKKAIAEIENEVKIYNEWIKSGHVGWKYEIEYKFLNTPLEECIKRDSRRENPIGETVIRNTYEKYKDVIDEISHKS